MAETELIDVQDMHILFHTLRGSMRAVDGVSFRVSHGETLGMVGESGCGKSVTNLALLQLIPMPPGELVKGHAFMKGHDLLRLSPTEIKSIRGNRISMIFQEPMTSLNPVFTIGDQIGESTMLHMGLGRKAAREKSAEMLDLVGIPVPRQRMKEFPHQLSGGMRQRVMIAMALSCEPDLLIADEPTTALDVTIQAQILELMMALQERTRMGIIMITHDLGVIAETADRVIVMYCGRVVESANVDALALVPTGPYTQLLLLLAWSSI